MHRRLMMGWCLSMMSTPTGVVVLRCDGHDGDLQCKQIHNVLRRFGHIIVPELHDLVKHLHENTFACKWRG